MSMLQWLFSVAIFLSAFLLFFVQPVLAKYIVPQFGGSSFVWITSLLFFQAALLLGYFYAYLLTKFFSERVQAIIHFIVLLASFYFIPIHLESSLLIESVWPPLDVLSILTSTILLPFMVLSASSPLLQHWYCTLKQTPYPYFYYSISNAGSLLGLLGYPLLLEPFIGTQKQSLLCSVIYTFYALLCALCLYQLRSSKAKPFPATEPLNPTSYTLLAKWLILAFLTSALLLATTQFLTQNVINVPLIWILPLAVYLISFITTFATPKGYEREFWIAIFGVFILLILKNIYLLTLNGIQIVIFILGLLYTACIICHGELVRAKPVQKDLTLFYLYIALGSVLGGLFANGLSLLVNNWWNLYLPLLMINFIILFISYHLYEQSKKIKDLAISIFCLMTLILFLLVIWVDTFPNDKKLIMQQRNLYGLLRIYDMQTESGFPYRMLLHGTVMHGLEYLEPEKQLWPTTYYGPNSGAGLAIQYLSQTLDRSLQIAVVGLGTGAISSLANPKDEITFYEIDPDIAKIAHQHFHFLSKSPAKSKVILGDARIQLTNASQTASPPQYDIIIIDAFSGDAIPFHLITKEALTLYASLLKPQGIIVFHTSNSFINLMPITTALAQHLGCNHFWIESQANFLPNIVYSTWAMISCNPHFADWLRQQKGFTISPNNTVKPLLWTDDENSILPILRIK